MDIQQLKTFLEVCRTRHFGHAAQNLYLTQSAVSFRIRQLETVLDTPLFVRHRNNLQLTPAGERLRVHADTILTTWQRARQEVSQGNRQHRPLTLAASVNVWSAGLDESLVDLHRQLPERHWRAETLTGDQMTRRLLERTLDLAVMTDPPKVDDLVTLPLPPLTLVMAAPAGVDLDRALASAYVLPDWGTRFLLDHEQRLDPPPTPALFTGDTRLAMRFMEQHHGCGFLPATRLDTAAGGWQRFEAPGGIFKTLYLVHHAHHPDRNDLAPVIDHLKAARFAA